MPDMTGMIKVGDPLTRYCRGRTDLVTVTKVGRKLFTVVTGERGREMVFRLETGIVNDDYGHYWVLTLAQAAEKERRHAAIDALRTFGLTFNSSARDRSATLEQLETLAALARAFTTKPEVPLVDLFTYNDDSASLHCAECSAELAVMSCLDSKHDDFPILPADLAVRVLAHRCTP